MRIRTANMNPFEENEVREKALKMYDDGELFKVICQRLHISNDRLNKWVRYNGKNKKFIALDMYFNGVAYEGLRARICKNLDISQAELNKWIEERYERDDKKYTGQPVRRHRQDGFSSWISHITDSYMKRL